MKGAAALALAAYLPGAGRATGLSAGRLVEHQAMPSKFVDPRNVTIWLPDGYDGGDRRYPVLYMHDGQNLFDDKRANFGVEWGIDEHVTALAAAGEARAAIVVGAWSTPKRFREYAPAGMVSGLPADVRARVEEGYGGPPLSDGYLRFIVDELKPMIDDTYRTLSGRRDTAIMGSSMGGLVSIYALCEYPKVFGGAACLSTHWPLVPIDVDHGATVPGGWQAPLIAASTRYLRRNLPHAGAHRLYFDHGDRHLDQFYQPYQEAVDRVVTGKGYRNNRDVISRAFPGTSHNERAWNDRADLPLAFLLGRSS